MTDLLNQFSECDAPNRSMPTTPARGIWNRIELTTPRPELDDLRIRIGSTLIDRNQSMWAELLALQEARLAIGNKTDSSPTPACARAPSLIIDELARLLIRLNDCEITQEHGLLRVLDNSTLQHAARYACTRLQMEHLLDPSESRINKIEGVSRSQHARQRVPRLPPCDDIEGIRLALAEEHDTLLDRINRARERIDTKLEASVLCTHARIAPSPSALRQLADRLSRMVQRFETRPLPVLGVPISSKAATKRIRLNPLPTSLKTRYGSEADMR